MEVKIKSDELIISEKVEYTTRDEKKIIAYIDRKNGTTDSKAYVIISPGYAETKRDYISTAYYLATNNFVVLRYDCINHLGESDGEIENFTLLDMENSMWASIEYMQDKFAVKSIGIIAASLAGRIAFRIASTDKRIEYVISLTSVMDLKDTISIAYKEDLITGYKKGKRWGVIDMLGFEVGDKFLEIAIKEKYEDLQSTIDDIKKIRCPICYIAAENDVWVKINDVNLIYKNTPNKKSKFIEMPGALHQIQENPKLAQKTIIEIVETCSVYSELKNNNYFQIKIPPIHEIVRENKIEASDFKAIFPVTKSDEKKFWVDYLSKFFVVIKSQDYQNLLSLIGQLLNWVEDGDRILDAGCGNGHFGAWILYNTSSIEKKHNRISFSYTGVDFANEAILDAKKIHANILKKIAADTNKYHFEYSVADLENELMFADEYFNKIYCNLVLSYLTNYAMVLKQLFSKLRIGGKIIVSSLKPYNDLSLIYKNYLDQNLTPEDILEGRKLLSSAGKIRHKEKQGHYHFFDKDELVGELKKAGFSHIKTFRAFGDQANMAIGEKL